jgi:hypothetical protein
MKLSKYVIIIISLIVLLSFGCGGGDGGGDSGGEDNPVQNVNMSGEWEGTTTRQNGTLYQTTLNLTQDSGGNIAGSWDVVSEKESYYSEDLSGTITVSHVSISIMVRNFENADDVMEFVYEGAVNHFTCNGNITITGRWNNLDLNEKGSFQVCLKGNPNPIF